MTEDVPAPALLDFLAHSGEMGALISSQDWNASALGAPQGWPIALKVTLATILNSPQPMSLSWGRELLFFFNDAYRPLLGARAGSAMGRPMAEVWSEVWDGPLVNRILGGEGLSFENMPLTLTRNGYAEATWWAHSLSPLRDNSGVVAGIYSIVTETTRQVLLAQQVAAEQQQQKFRVELGDALRDASVPDALMVIAAEKLGRHLQVGCVGYGEVDAAGEWICVHQDWGAEGSPGTVGTHRLDNFGPASINELRAGRTIAVNDIVTDPLTAGAAHQAMYKASGARAFINAPLIRDGRLAVVLFVLHPQPRVWTHDETSLVEEVAERTWSYLQRLRAELAARQSHETLVQRTHELLHTETALRQSQKLEALGKLTGGVAHDFNNLLAVISSSVELLRHEKLPVERRGQYLDLIFDTVGRAVKLTSQLLAFARKQPLDPKLFDVDLQVQAVVDLVRPLMGSHVSVHFDPCGQRACFAMADINQFETALVNLAVNARDAMKAQGRLSFKVQMVNSIPAGPGRSRRAGEFVAISVADTGVGIAVDKLEAIFEPFYTTKLVGEGTGLGLSQVLGFAKQSGGDIDVTSELGIGSVFSLYLSRAESPSPAEEWPAIAEPGANGHGLRVLVVEDNSQLAQMTCEVLNSLEYPATWAASAEAALELLAGGAGRFDLVFSDVVMPGMNGIELGKLVRLRNPGLAVVLTSGYSSVMAEQGRHGFELIHKPYTSEVLVRVFAKAAAEQASSSRRTA